LTEPKFLIWGKDDGFQKIVLAERFAAEIPNACLRIDKTEHILTANDPGLVAPKLLRVSAA
jgi:pimeloyl-ACP methyl ester carboxylesterase